MTLADKRFNVSLNSLYDGVITVTHKVLDTGEILLNDEYTNLSYQDYDISPSSFDTYLYLGLNTVDDGAYVDGTATVTVDTDNKTHKIYMYYGYNSYTVTFIDHNGTVLGIDTVTHGNPATAPVEPTRTGYTFTGWDSDYSNVTNDLTVTALYNINSYTVNFVDYDGTALKTETVNYGGSATAPVNPTRTGYSFTGWDVDFSNVVSDMTVTATYSINSYIVTFIDYDNTVLDTQVVNYGNPAIAPVDPIRVGYSFSGWDKDFSNITADLTITAQYSINSYALLSWTTIAVY